MSDRSSARSTHARREHLGKDVANDKPGSVARGYNSRGSDPIKQGDDRVRVVAEFQIQLLRYLDAQGQIVQELPRFAQDTD